MTVLHFNSGGGMVQNTVALLCVGSLLTWDDAVVIPGHGENTTIGREKRFNPFLQNL